MNHCWPRDTLFLRYNKVAVFQANLLSGSRPQKDPAVLQTSWSRLPLACSNRLPMLTSEQSVFSMQLQLIVNRRFSKYLVVDNCETITLKEDLTLVMLSV